MTSKPFPPYEPPRQHAPYKFKAFGFILRRMKNGKYGLLAYTSDELPTTYRVPGGNLEGDEDPLEGMFREIEEECGLTRDDFDILRQLGEVEYFKPFIEKNVQRHDYQLILTTDTPNEWMYTVKGEGNDAGAIYRYRFLTHDEHHLIQEELRTFVTPEHMPEFFGVENRTVVILDYDPAWALIYDVTSARLHEAIGTFIDGIAHIGSTSVPNLAAKPIIDILITVDSLEEADNNVVQRIVDLGYQYVPEYEATMPNRRYFRGFNKGGIVTEHIHLYQKDAVEVENYLLFRDYLRTHPEARDAYEKLKRELAATLTRAEYTEAKSDFIADILNKARQKGT